MGSKRWRYLSLLAFASAVLAGCNTPNSANQQALKGPPQSPQMAQRPVTFPGSASNNQQAFPQAADPQRQVFSTMGATPNALGQAPTPPVPGGAFPQNPGTPISTQSQTFAPAQPPVLANFPPMNGPGAVPLPGNTVNGQIPPQSTIFPGGAPNNFPAVPPPGSGFPPQR